jgi:hypothetical protein
LRTPSSEWRIHHQPISTWCPPSLSRQVRLHRSFVNEHKPFWGCAHRGHAPLFPIGAPFPYPRTQAFGGDQSLFLYV